VKKERENHVDNLVLPWYPPFLWFTLGVCGGVVLLWWWLVAIQKCYKELRSHENPRNKHIGE